MSLNLAKGVVDKQKKCDEGKKWFHREERTFLKFCYPPHFRK